MTTLNGMGSSKLEYLINKETLSEKKENNDFNFRENNQEILNEIPTKDKISSLPKNSKSETINLEFVSNDSNIETPKQSQIPSEADIKKGAVIKRSEAKEMPIKGEIIAKVQTLLTKSGFPVKSNGEFGKMTQELIKDFQKMAGIQQNGCIGKQTLDALEKVAGSSNLRNNIVKEAEKRRQGAATSSCFACVADAVEKAMGKSGIYHGIPASGAAAQMAARPDKFKEIFVDSKKLKNLPAGAIVVWPNNPSEGSRAGYKYGHISVSDGKGNEISFYKDKQMESHYAGGTFPGFPPKTPRIFLPLK